MTKIYINDKDNFTLYHTKRINDKSNSYKQEPVLII